MKRYLGVVAAAALLGGMVTVASDAQAAGHGGGGGGFRGGYIGGHIGGGVGSGHIGGGFVGGRGFAGRGGGLPYGHLRSTGLPSGHLRSGPLVTGLPSGQLRSGPLVTGAPSGQLRSGRALATLFGLFEAGRYSGASYGQGSPTHTSPANTRQQQQGSPEISYNISGNYGGTGNGSPGGV